MHDPREAVGDPLFEAQLLMPLSHNDLPYLALDILELLFHIQLSLRSLYFNPSLLDHLGFCLLELEKLFFLQCHFLIQLQIVHLRTCPLAQLIILLL